MRTLLFLLLLISACAPAPIKVVAPDDEGKPTPSEPKNRKVYERK